MTFLDRQTTRKAQQARKHKRTVDTPDRPGTTIAYSQTGKRPEGVPFNSVGQAIRDAEAKASQPTQRVDAAAAMRRMAGGK